MSRTFKVSVPPQHGTDIEAWQKWLNGKMRDWNVDYSLDIDGFYGARSRDLTASVAYGMGMNPGILMARGVTPDLRTKMRHGTLNAEERKMREERHAKGGWLDRFRQNHVMTVVSTPTPVIISSSWGWHPGVHDGVDLIAPWKNPALAICEGKIVRVSPSGWWGNNPQPSPGHPVSDGDGIIILECTISAGPFKPGLHFGYGHSEGATVRVGDHVKAGQVIGHVGFANAAHIHFMVNDDQPVNGFYRGVGDRDPMPFVTYALSNA
jgi:murein DD-endopeptidase MepM/ murein hydrolase activator NlpD